MRPASRSAKGIPDRGDYGDLSLLGEDALATLVRQRHNADRARLHEDLRIGTPSGLYSWAVPKFIPKVENVRRLAVRQPLHNWSYKDFQGRLNRGYGRGTVEKMEESPVVVLKNSPGHLVFTRGDTRKAAIYDLLLTRHPDWLLTMVARPIPDAVRNYRKEHFKAVPVDRAVELIRQGAEASPKIDGAGAIAYLGKDGVRVFGVRPGASGDRPEYTDLIGGLRSVRVPKDLRGTLLRGEVFGVQGGRSIHANDVAGLLNSTILNAARRRKGDGIRLLLAGLAVNRNGVDEYDQTAVNNVVKALGSDRLVPMRRYSGKDAERLLERMKAGDNPLTREGVVLHVPGSRPLKAKFTDDADVIIRNIFKADTNGGPSRAGGFEYSLPGSDKVVGRVGTGFTHAMLVDMLAHPENYVGRTARIHSQEQYPSGAFRAPGFVAMKED